MFTLIMVFLYPFSIYVVLIAFISLDYSVRAKSDISGNKTNSSFKLQNASVDNINQTLSNNTYNTFGILSTLANLSTWAAKEESVVKLLSKRHDIINKEQQLIENYLKDYHDSTGKVMKREPNKTPEERGKIVGSSAILSHRMINRYSGILENYRKLITSPEFQENHMNVSTELNIRNNSATWIGSRDLVMSMKSFIRMQQSNAYHLEELVKSISEYSDPHKLSLNAMQSATMGIYTMTEFMHYMAVEWLEYAMNQTKPDDKDHHNDLVNSLYNIVVQNHNRDLSDPSFENFFWGRLDLYLEPIPFSRIPGRRVASQLMTEYYDEDALLEANFMSLCQGKNLQTAKQQAKLKCYYEKYRHPYLYINPVKVEHLSETPPIYQFYEMIDSKTITNLHKNSAGKLKTSRVILSDNERDSAEDIRTSAGCAVDFNETPENAAKLADKVTGLKLLNGVDKLNYIEYTYGRYYNYHPDPFLNASETEDHHKVLSRGNRVATILYYLEIPEKGGHTPFCNAGVYVRPVRGSAAFWYNLYRNGTTRDDVYHGSCPVLHGHKIILNHWIRYHDNWQNFRCSLNSNE